MKSFASAIAVLSSVAFLGLAASAAFAEPHVCTGEGPECVLQCYAQAFADRDSVSLGLLLSPDYIKTEVGGPNQRRLDYAATLKTTVPMFRSPNQRPQLELGKPQAIEAGPLPGTWILRHVPMIFRMVNVADGRPVFEAHKLLTLSVRREVEPPLHYVIVREERRDPGKEQPK